MAKVEMKKPSQCTAGPVTSASIKGPLNVLQMIVASCYGPTGRLKHVHNGSGGYVITTSQSSALLGGLSISHPVLQLLVSSVRNHVSHFNDGGLFAAILCCNLIDRCLALPLSPHKVITINKRLLDMCLSYLTSEDCACKLKVDFSCNSSFFDLTRSVLCSKPACMVTIKEVDYITVLVVKAFLFKVPLESRSNMVLGRTVMVPVEGLSVMESTLVPGVLIEMPGSSWNRILALPDLPPANIKLALFSVSMSGDFSDTGDGSVDVVDSVNPEHVMLEQLLALGKQLVDDHVHVLVCQKVIHPSLMQYLKEQKILAVERLGAALMEPLSQMTGAQSIASLSSLSSACYGSLGQISKMSHGNKQYLHLIPSDTSVCSFLLCNRNETSLKELVRVCQTAENTLNHLLKDPWLLLGGGCTETHLAAYVRYKNANIHSSHLEGQNCSVAEYKLVSECFSSCLESAARSLEHDGGDSLTDLQDGHFWSIPPNSTLDFNCIETGQKCGCQLLGKGDDMEWSMLGGAHKAFSPRSSTDVSPLLINKEPLVVDGFTAKYNGLRVAVDTAGLILDLAYVIKDEN
ncbi:McKusick-Kaufman/Bardet-Biedl syndromes putative chaperonin [Rana temporaria]|uniref:McKusick-Kaufman/Bardet-Biedl syndromes putative chaperonin n=1 Tax=Rana temporaria TaxID=8407 RepID=UPI001AADA163|nr:McKusick-Kaufman/Bardet-Biedl syndromes putative chaperonin [Rana temporaria]XP_040207237.1 McKusick-Kaufman/Bardet-Biedl syndromes putative chaperonin [Rana temporaria]XP_040207238.1 McKusick-Kaufman/Bardet-Biedl syndromes putative chaperonin [Rana temporaria]XP_040207239.1 McKusick-Kaufman/Bardet-Biedl syndromes putative chaperonin [Rana temporaria]